jgi:hypothetical protein
MKQRLRKKQLKKYRGRSRVRISNVSEGMCSTSLGWRDIDSVTIKRDITEGKNLITVNINDELVFSFDSNFQGKYWFENNIQKPMEN